MSYIIVGAGGHGRVIKDILIQQGFEILGFVDDGVKHSTVCKIPILGKVDDIKNIIQNYEDVMFIVGIGDNKIRKSVSQYIKASEGSFGSAIHPSAILGSNVYIEDGTVIMPNVVVNTGSHIGSHVILNTSSVIEHDNFIEDFAHISPGATLTGAVTIGEGTQVGAGATIIPGVSVGKWSTVGAGATVINKLPDECLAVGSPAKILSKEHK